jgi:hypothetical protein
MSIQMTGLFRKQLSESKAIAAQNYRKELANELAQYDPRREELAPKYEAETVQISSLQSEGQHKHHPSSIKLDGTTDQDLENYQQKLRDDTSALPRIASGRFDEESKSVLQEIKSEIDRRSNSQGEYFLLPGTQVGTDKLVTRAVCLDEQGYIAGGFNVALHDTPGLDDGLMLITPISNRDLQHSGEYLRADVFSRQTVSLNAIDQGFQYHKFN